MQYTTSPLLFLYMILLVLVVSSIYIKRRDGVHDHVMSNEYTMLLREEVLVLVLLLPLTLYYILHACSSPLHV